MDYVPRSSTSEPDLGTLLGLVAAFGLVFGAIVLQGSLSSFFDASSLLIVLGGTLGGTLIAYPYSDFVRSIQIARPALYPDAYSPQDRLSTLVELSKTARQEGELSLESVALREQDPFLRKGLELLVDGVPVSELRRILELEILSLEERHSRGIQLFQTMGSIAPATGLIGTLIGLVHMLERLDDPSQIGPGMATALLTTFYGAFLAYLLFIPLAAKLRRRSEEESLLKELSIEGLVCISEGVNPRLIEQRLQSFLSPAERYSSFESYRLS